MLRILRMFTPNVMNQTMILFHKSQECDGITHQIVFTCPLQTIFTNKPVGLLIHPLIKRKRTFVTIILPGSIKAKTMRIRVSYEFISLFLFLLVGRGEMFNLTRRGALDGSLRAQRALKYNFP